MGCVVLCFASLPALQGVNMFTHPGALSGGRWPPEFTHPLEKKRKMKKRKKLGSGHSSSRLAQTAPA